MDKLGLSCVIVALASCLSVCPCRAEEALIEPAGTYLYAEKSGENLFMDLYVPADSLRDESKPVILFMFGGGFIQGERNEGRHVRWFGDLVKAGYPVVSIDYRLGLKNEKKLGISSAGKFEEAINMAVEDLYDATLFIIANGEELGINPYNIVLSGSSAGAITVLQAEYELCNDTPRSKVLPEGFDYKGIMAFAGCVFSTKGKPVYARTPCPTMMLHGTKDRLVPYSGVSVFNLMMASSPILFKVMSKAGCNCRIYRYKGVGHDVAAAYGWALNEELDFLKRSVVNGERLVLDQTVSESGMPKTKYGGMGFKDLKATDD